MELKDMTALIALLISAYAVYANTREWERNRLIKGVEIIQGYSNRFSEEKFRKYRKEASIYLLNKTKDPTNPPVALIEILGLFEEMSYFQEKGIIEIEAIWNFFASWLLPYISASMPILEEYKKQDSTIYEGVRNLYTAVEKLERKLHPSKFSAHMVSPGSVKEFLESESKGA